LPEKVLLRCGDGQPSASRAAEAEPLRLIDDYKALFDRGSVKL
jgi:hypothetical protein